MSPTATKTKSKTERKSEIERRAEIAHILNSEGAHAVMMLPTQGDYDFAMSPFELFVLRGTQIQLRKQLNMCTLYTMDNEDGTKQFALATSSTVGGTFYETDFQAKVPGDLPKEQDPAFQFAAAGNSMPFFRSWNFLWEHTLLSEFAGILRDWHIWKQIPAWGKYPASKTTDIGTSDSAGYLGQIIGKSLFTSLDAFLIDPGNEPKFHEKLRCGNWADGITPSLRTTIKILERISREKLARQTGWETDCAFSKEQLRALRSIRQDLSRFTKPSKFWIELTEDPKFNEHDRIKSLDRLTELIDEQIKDVKEHPENRPKLLANYIHTARNAIAHNRQPIDLQELYLLRVGYEGVAEKLIGEAIEECFRLLLRIYTEVFGLQEKDLLIRREEADQNAEQAATQILLGTSMAEVAK